MLSRGLECSLQGWNAFDRVGMLSTEMEYLCSELESFLQGWNTSYSVRMLSTGLECFSQS
jgi:hypothetical protein